MTNDAIEWIEDNLPTTTIDGTKMVVREHDTDGETDCSICGRPHTPTTERHDVLSLADQYHDAILDGNPVEEAKERGAGHERFFDQ